MHHNIHRILRRAGRILLNAYHEGVGQEDRVVLAWSKLNPGSNIKSRVWPGKPLPLDPSGEETAAAARLVASALGLRLVNMTDLEEGIVPGAGDLLLLRGIEGHEDPLVTLGHQSAPLAGFFINACVKPPIPEATPSSRRSSQSSLF